MTRDDSDKTSPNLNLDQTIGPDDAARKSTDPESQPTIGPNSGSDPDRTIGPTSQTPMTGSGHEQTMFAGSERRPISERNINIEGYEILDELGRGGMGVVYKARDRALNRIVALKMILAGAHASDEAIARFKIEAEAVAQLQHRGIVQVYDVGQADGQPYCALEFIDGGGLDDLMANEKLSIAESVAIVEELASAMSSAHQAGIVHRDLKPANVLISRAGSSSASSINVDDLGQYRPRITDFGLAKKVEQESHQTQTGAIMGTPGYMAPEQARGAKRIGPAADIYSLGAILYHMVTGKPPFIGETPIKTIMQVINDPAVPPRNINTTVDRDLDTIILKCLEKQPTARYASAEHLAQDLHRYQAGMPIEARPVSGVERLGKWIRRKPWAAAMIGLMSLGIIGVMVGGAIFNNQLSAANREIEQERKIAVEALTETSRALAAESKALSAESAALEKTDAALKRVEVSEAQSRRRLIDNYVNNGLQAMNDHQTLQALPWLSEALVMENNPDQQAVHQLRFSLAVQASPKPERTWLTDGAIMGCAISDDGKQVASIGSDRFIRFYDVKSNELVRVLESPSQIIGFDISGDQRQAIVVSVTLNVASGDFSTHNYDVQFCDVKSGKMSPPFQFTTNGTTPVQPQLCAETGCYLHHDKEGNQLQLIDLESLDVSTTFPLAGDPQGIRINETGQYAAIDDGQSLTIWSIEDTKSPRLRLPRQATEKPREFCYDFASEDRLVVVDQTTRLFDLATTEPISEFPRSAGGAARFALGPAETGFAIVWPNGQLEITGFDGTPVDKRSIRSQLVRLFYSDDGRVLFVATNMEVLRFDTSSGRQIGSPIPSTLKPLQMADFNTSSGLLAICSGAGAFIGSGCLRLWNIRDDGHKYLLPRPDPEAKLDFVRADQDGRIIALVSDKRTRLTIVDVTNRRRPKITYQAPLSKEPIRSVRWSKNGQRLAMAVGNRVRVLADRGRKTLCEIPLESPRRMQFSSNGSQLAISYGDRSKLVAVVDANSGRVLVPEMKHKRSLEALQFINNDEQLATISADLNFRLFDTKTGKRLKKSNLRMAPTSAVINGTGTLAAVCGERLGESPGRLSFVDVFSGKLAIDPLDFNSSLNKVALSPDGSLLGLADTNGIVRIIEVDEGTDRGLLLVHPDTVSEIHFSSDNRLLMTVCRDKRVRLFDAHTGVLIAAPAGLQAGPESAIRSASFLGNTYDIIEQNETALIWQIGNGNFTANHASTLSRFLSGSVISNQGTIVPTPTQSLKEDFSNVTMRQILDSNLIRHLIPK